MDFGKNLRKLRIENKMSQEQLADKVGVSRQSVSKWECGEAYPEMKNILCLCDLFHCKITHLVNENLSDISSFDEETKQNVIKFEKEKQKKMKTLSKFIYIMARIGKILTIVGITFLVVLMILSPFFYNKDFFYTNPEMLNLNLALYDFFQNKSNFIFLIHLEIKLSFALIVTILDYFILKHLEQVFINIHDGYTPFTLENASHLKKIAIFMIIATLLPSFSELLNQLIIHQNLNLSFNVAHIIYILFLISMVYIFEYGYEIQQDSRGKMFTDENDVTN